ncbi:MAG: response regulator [Ignavibacteriae bacterium]|nr:response regulator [Ignavibacteriota bacterium]
MPDKIKLLVVDDEDALRSIIKDQLEGYDFEVDTAEDGVHAVNSMQSKRYDVILLDIRMPGMDGMEVLKTIREKNLARKVIMLTAVDELKVAKDSLLLGADDFITKPYDIRNLVTCINRTLKE